MNFNLRTPCNACPFVVGSSTNQTLAEGRIEEIVDEIRDDKSFTCHKTLDKPAMNHEHCAGAAIFLENEDSPNQMMRIAERLRFYDRHKLYCDKEIINNEDY